MGCHKSNFAQRIIPELETTGEPDLKYGSSTNYSIRRYRKMNAL
jgi:hypothetical protein